jgi:multicomponent Na+:H+ antiporter subunit G
VTWLGGTLMLVGAFFFFAGTVGFYRLPDFFTRMHAISKSDTLGASLSMLGVACCTGWSLISVKLVLVAVFIFIANPTATHAIARASLAAGVRPWQRGDGR